MGIPCRKHKRNRTYTPDFWCPEDNCYYEVSATRQAHDQSIKKICFVLEKDESIPIRIVKPDGKSFPFLFMNIDQKLLDWLEQQSKDEGFLNLSSYLRVYFISLKASAESNVFAMGKHLDKIGECYGVKRLAEEDDEEYRKRLLIAGRKLGKC